MKRIGLLIGLMLATVVAHATVTSQTTSVTYTCTGSTGPYAFTFSASAPAAITVTENNVLLSTSAYTVTAVNNNLDNGGSVTLNSACTSGQLVITRVTPLTQTSVFTDNMPIPMKTFENGLDKLTEIDQEAQIAINNLENLGCTPGNVLQSLNGPVCVALPVPGSGGGGGTPQSQVNVMAYGAKGDCVTDDRAAIQSALNVQGISTPQITVYFPAPPGGCYLTSTLTFTGASMQGQAGYGFVGQTGAGVILKGKPGLDVLHVPDPTTVGSVGPRAGWSIRDLVISPDGTNDVSSTLGAHRWPGKWDSTCGISATSHALACSNMEFSCADIGNNILVKGAGTSGADLSTTVATVFPCWQNIASSGQPTVTLTAAAGTTVTNHLAYIAPAGLSVTQTVGNCGIAMDNYDGNSADWVMTGNTSSWAPSLYNVTFATVNVGFNSTCGMYFGATWNPYLSYAQNLTFWNLTYGVVEGMPDTNPQSASGIGQDYQKWDHGIMLTTYPWISINDGELTMTDYQLRSNNGMQIQKYLATNEPQPTGWTIHNPEFESSGSGIGYRIEGGLGAGAGVMRFDGTELSAGKNTYIETANGRYHEDGIGTLYIGGSNNWLDNVTIISSVIHNSGMDNIIDGSYGTTSSTMIPTTEMTQTINRGRNSFGTLTPDFIRNGTPPYYSDHDLFIWPQDLTDIFGNIYQVVVDTDSWTGNYAALPTGENVDHFNNMYMLGRTNTNQIFIGSNVPAGPALIELSYKCPSISTFNLTIQAGGTTVAGPTATACSTTYATATITADFTSYSGQAVNISISAGETDIAWMAIVPIGNINMTSAKIPGAHTGDYVLADGTGYGPGLLYGITGTITGTSLSGSCDSGTATVSGAVVGDPVMVSRGTGADVGAAFTLRASVTATNTVTVYVCGTGTPSNDVYQVAVYHYIPPP